MIIHSCCEAWEELGKGNRCELQASLSGDGGQVQGGGGKTSPKSGGATSMPGGYRLELGTCVLAINLFCDILVLVLVLLQATHVLWVYNVYNSWVF